MTEAGSMSCKGFSADGHRTLHQTKLKQGERKHCPRFVDILGWKVCSSLDEAWGYLFSKPLYQQGIQVESVVVMVFPEVRCHHPSVDCEVKHAGRMGPWVACK
ncbi:hypothetical protein M758_2G183200 [Ceratodon purpureus]|nr:hypothetical protein M758_2G183200 [Ceratodon purpureus]